MGAKQVADLKTEFSAEKTLFIENAQILIPMLSALQSDQFSLFMAENPTMQELTFQNLIKIFKVLQPGGHIKINFKELSKEDFEALRLNLEAVGFDSPKQNSFSTQIIYSKHIKSTPLVINTVKEETKKENKPPVVGTFVYDKTETIVPEVKKPAPAKKPNPFANLKGKEIISEDTLLNGDKFEVKTIAKEDCSTKPKACKNCACGRADAEMRGDLEAGNIKSACGNCYLGDAFRCGSCPYKGLPAFKPGDKVKLDLGFSDSNNMNLDEN